MKRTNCINILCREPIIGGRLAVPIYSKNHLLETFLKYMLD